MIVLTKNDINLIIDHINNYKYIDKFIISNLIKISIMYEFILLYRLHHYDVERIFIKITKKKYINIEYSQLNKFYLYIKKFINMKNRKLYSTEQKALITHLNSLLDNYHKIEQDITILENFMIIYLLEHYKNYLDIILLKREKITNKEIEYCNNIKNIFYSKYKYIYNGEEFIQIKDTKKYYKDPYFPLIWR